MKEKKPLLLRREEGGLDAAGVAIEITISV